MSSLGKRKSSPSRVAYGALRVAVLGAAALACGSCTSFDTKRVAPPKATLGDDLYGVMCDRVGASALPEDLSGESYQGVCHYDDKGHYADQVDQKLLPKPGKGEEKNRELSIAKLDAMVRHRSDLIRAFNATFPDEKIDDPTKKNGKQIRLHDALMDFTQRLAPLYDENPYLKGSDPLIPASTRALGRLFDALGGHDAPDKGKDPSAPALAALQQMAARKGYRPFNVALGAIRPALAYPNLRELTQAALKVLGPTGVASPELQQLLAVSKQELLTSEPLIAKLAPLEVNAAIAQPNRPRTKVEVAKAMLLSTNDAFAEYAGDPSRYLALRDRRGFVLPIGNQPGVPGTVPSPFVDADGDGFADVDGFGRFVGADRAPLSLQPPFLVPDAD
ncbi:MAG TPA: hypothetical protein VHB21_07565, partial [Minicystis sp.]|nr:hypothetical protein [Minicystis sp.]